MNILPSRGLRRTKNDTFRDLAAEQHDKTPHLTAAERRRVALASLEILEQEFLKRLGQIRADRRSLLAQGSAP